ncbi:glycoside hydrolase family 3 C-terminal domain-containing protein [Novosphingobium subterraneum]|uniref:glycoside hydrolase family 3 C-terminal domain-containing protein n=1 Tax=Novosphingobium subterraneum TaxID=48936 RepID=UPI003D00B659
MKPAARLSCSAAMLALGCVQAQANPVQASRDTAEARAEQALSQMTLEEKIQLLHGTMPLFIPVPKRAPAMPVGAGVIAGIERLGIPPQYATDASLGVSNIMDMRKGDVATALPSGLSLASTWNPALVREGGRMIGSEAVAKGFNVMLAGGVNLVRDPRAGRNFEYLGEDPLLGGVLVGAQIEGVQANGIIATIKHFALNNQEIGRSSASVEMDEAAMRESDLLAFQIGMERGNPGSVMCSYNKVGGTYACENRFLLTDVLRREWGFKGYVMSDWGAVHSAEALLAGLDQQSGEMLDRKRWFSTELKPKLADGSIPISAVDTAAKRILWAIYAKGVDKTVIAPRAIDYARNGEVALQAAREGTVLLRNEGGILPLAASVRSIVVIGGKADLGVPSGGGSSQVVPVGGFRAVEKIESGPAATFARRAWGGTPPLEALRRTFGKAQVTYVDGSDAKVAADAAQAADVAVVFATKFATEAEDQPDLALDGRQDALIDAVASANPRTVVVLETGNPVTMPWLAKVPAVLVAWYPGQRGGDAIAEILSGKTNPSGRLPVTFPVSVDQLPNPVLPGSDLPPPSKEEKATYGLQTNSPPFTITYPEGADVGYRWFDRKGEKPLFAFGHGLSYTTFRYSALRAKGGRTVSVSFTVTNSGAREGADVPQVYVTLPGKTRRLIGWDKPVLKPGESRTVTITADPRLLASFDVARQRWEVKPGRVKIEVARSAGDPVLATQVSLAAQTIKP